MPGRTKKDSAEKARIYAAEFIKDMSISQAYKRAFNSQLKPKSLCVQSSIFFAKEMTQEAVQAAMDARAKRVGIEADHILRELASVAFSDIGDLFNEDGSFKALKDIPVALRKAISHVEIMRGKKDANGKRVGYRVEKIKVWDKLNALDKLGRHLKLFGTDKPVSDADGGPVIKGEMSDLELARRVLFILEQPLQKKKTA